MVQCHVALIKIACELLASPTLDDSAEGPSLLDRSTAFTTSARQWSEYVKVSVLPNWTKLETDRADHFPAQLCDIHKLTDWCSKVKEHVCNVWASNMESSTKKVESTAPPCKLINDPTILTDKGLQAALFDREGHQLLVGNIKGLSDQLAMLKTMQDMGVAMTGSLCAVHKRANKLKKDAKRAAAAYFCIHKILHFTDAGPESREALAKSCQERLDSLSVEAPAGVTNMLRLMKG